MKHHNQSEIHFPRSSPNSHFPFLKQPPSSPMARQLTNTLSKFSLLPRFSSLSSKTIFSHNFHLLEIDLDPSSSSSVADIEVVSGLKRLEDAIHSIIVRKLEPNWIAFRPGSSYWVPPSRSIADNLVRLVDRFNNRPEPLTEEQSLSFLASHGWPSSSFFLDHETEVDNSTSNKWVPPSHTVAENLGQFLDQWSSPLTKEESMSLTSSHGWPSSAYFLDQVSPSVIEVHVYSQKSENEPLSDEE